MWTKAALLEVLENRLREHRLILVSNREPYSHRHVGGAIECAPAVSGAVSALEPIVRACGGVWIAHGSGDADRETANARGYVHSLPKHVNYTLRRVWLSPAQVAGYYDGLCNAGFWPLCHLAHVKPVFDPEAWPIYREVNEQFAQAVLEDAGDDPAFVFVQDFHLSLVPRMLKEANANLIVAQFWHIPWPNPEVFQAFPWKEELLDGLLGNDLLGFHLRLHCQNFLETADRTVECKVDRERCEITRGGRTTVVRPFPIGIDFEAHERLAAGPEVAREMARWRKLLGPNIEALGIGIDRIDYTKGIPERLRGLDRFLELHPEYRGRLAFVQIGVPSRTKVPQYQLTDAEIGYLITQINDRWATPSWQPIVYVKQQHAPAEMMALHRLADFCVVSSLDDGMNLVAKEFVASRSDENGVLILSRFTGAARELTSALLVNPFALDELAEAIRQALEMPPEERQKRMQRLRTEVAANNVYRWAGKFLSQLLKFELPEAERAECEFSTQGM